MRRGVKTMTGGASIYILRCADGSYYTGITRRAVEERVSEHANGVPPGCFLFAASRRPGAFRTL